MAYAAITGKKAVVVLDGRPGRTYDGDFVEPLTFSPDGERLAYVVHNDKKDYVVVDGHPSEERRRYRPGPTFSPNSKHVAYVATKGKTKSVVLDGQPGAEYDEIFSDCLTFYPDGALECLAARDHALYRVKCILAQ